MIRSAWMSMAGALVACGGPQEATIATHPVDTPSTSAEAAAPALGQVRWIDVGQAVRDVSVSARRIAAVLDDGSIETFDLATGARATARPADPSAPPTVLSISPDGSLVTHCVGLELSVIDVEQARFEVLSENEECELAALWSPDASRVYPIYRGHRITARDVRTRATLATGTLLGDALVTSDGNIVSEGERRIAVIDANLAPVSSVTVPALEADHDSSGNSFLLAVIDAHTFLYASGVGALDVALVHDGQAQMLWRSPQNEAWHAAFPLTDERAAIVVEREGEGSVRVVNARSGQMLAEIDDVSEPFDVSADGTIAAAASGLRIAVIGVH